MSSPRKNLPALKADMGKRMKGPSWEKEKRPTQERGLHPRVSEMKGKSDRANKPGAEATAQHNKHFTKDSKNGSYGEHGRVAGGWEQDE